MSLQLKDYQERVIESLRMFCRQCAKDGHPEAAFQSVLLRNGREPEPYLPVSATGLAPGMPPDRSPFGSVRPISKRVLRAHWLQRPSR